MSESSWTIFNCDNPDFIVRSVPDNVEFRVRRASLEGSEAFADMFSCCDAGFGMVMPNDNDQALDLDESATSLAALLRLLHSPPPPPIVSPSDVDEKYITQLRGELYRPNTMIPFPLLPGLFALADKYMLSEPLWESLRVHLLAHAPMFPLRVYGLAVQYHFHSVAAKASKYLLHPPLSTYTEEEIKVIPTVAAYHNLVQLHDVRVKRLREVLLGESIFPHGYGACSVHTPKTTSLWEDRRKCVLNKLEAGTDVAFEMSTILQTLQSCTVCEKAGTAAVDMLAYKCRKLPRSIDHLPPRARAISSIQTVS